MPYTRRLDVVEQRVCGSLMEKQQTTPDNYPLTVNSLVSACNQKSNREPVMSLGEEQVRDALERLRKDVLVWRSSGARAEKWDHRLASRWHLDDRGLAVMTLLLLRGPQTPGELRSRSGRLHEFSGVEQVEATLQALGVGDNALVEELARQPGQRESRWRHLMGKQAEAAAPRDVDSGGPDPIVTGGEGGAVLEADRRPVAAHEGSHEASELEVLLERVERLEGVVDSLVGRLQSLESELGVGDQDPD